MDQFNTTQDFRAFEKEFFNVQKDYCNDRESYPTDTVLAIQPKTFEITIDCQDQAVGYEIEPQLCGVTTDCNESNDLTNK